MQTPPKHIKELENAGGASNANKAEMPITPKDCQEKHAGPFIGRRVARLPAPCQEKQAQKTPALPLSVPQLENVMALMPLLYLHPPSSSLLLLFSEEKHSCI